MWTHFNQRNYERMKAFLSITKIMIIGAVLIFIYKLISLMISYNSKNINSDLFEIGVQKSCLIFIGLCLYAHFYFVCSSLYNKIRNGNVLIENTKTLHAPSPPSAPDIEGAPHNDNSSASVSQPEYNENRSRVFDPPPWYTISWRNKFFVARQMENQHQF